DERDRSGPRALRARGASSEGRPGGAPVAGAVAAVLEASLKLRKLKRLNLPFASAITILQRAINALNERIGPRGLMAGSSRKVALITGATGQDGAYLAEFLLSKGYVVHGVKRRSSSFNTERINHMIHDTHEEGVSFHLHYGDVTDATNIIRIVQETQPDEIYNLAAQSHVQVSFETPEYTANADGLGTLRLLEAIRILGRET